MATAVARFFADPTPLDACAPEPSQETAAFFDPPLGAGVPCARSFDAHCDCSFLSGVPWRCRVEASSIAHGCGLCRMAGVWTLPRVPERERRLASFPRSSLHAHHPGRPSFRSTRSLEILAGPTMTRSRITLAGRAGNVSGALTIHINACTPRPSAQRDHRPQSAVRKTPSSTLLPHRGAPAQRFVMAPARPVIQTRYRTRSETMKKHWIQVVEAVLGMCAPGMAQAGIGMACARCQGSRPRDRS